MGGRRIAGVTAWHSALGTWLLNVGSGASVIVNQWVPAAHRGDAIGDSARRVRSLLRAMGHTSDLYALSIDDDLRGDVRPFEDPASGQGDVTIFHFALPSPMTARFASLPRGRILQYHNITPAHFFAPYDAGLFRLASLGRSELRTLAGRVDLALGDSDFNRQELEQLGFEPTGVMPIAIDVDRIARAPRRPALETTLGDGLVNFLFVGRLAPNKRIEDHIRLAEQYKRYVDVDYRFIFVGRYDGVPRYHATIRALLDRYEMPPERFVFTGAVPDEDLAAYYRTARVYISLSEHEGFCVPIIEAMAAGKPVIVPGITAMPETAGDAGLRYEAGDVTGLAGRIRTLADDRGLYAGLSKKAIARAREYEMSHVLEGYANALLR